MTQQARKPMTFSRADTLVASPPSNDTSSTNRNQTTTVARKEATKVAADRQQLGARVSKDLYRRFKVHAALTGAKMDALIEEAMREYLASKVEK